MKKNIKSLLLSGLVFMMLGMVSCVDYLDREPESILNEETAFRSFINFQSYTEELYHLLPDVSKHNYNGSCYNWGEDITTSLGGDRNRANVHIDNGNYMALLGLWTCFLDRPAPGNGSWGDDPNRQKSIWAPSWYGIRKANIGLANLDRLTEATQEEKNLIKGQLLFFRALLHFQIIQYWGPMPYINQVLAANESPRLPRPTYHQVAELIAKDLREAADLLPFHWDKTVAGQRTFGFNRWRATKAMALGFLAKNYIYAASPLMNRQSTGNSNYDPEFAKKAAAAAGELLSHVDSRATHHRLLPWDSINDVFWTIGRNWLIPGGAEAIFQAPNYHAQSTNWHNSRVFAPVGVIGRELPVFVPTANYVNYYGMANGLPLNHPQSGFDPEYPWRGRDPRFYKDIIYDGVKMVEGALPARVESRRYATLHTNGEYRSEETGSRTGYLVYKWIPIVANNYDVQWDQAYALTLQQSYIRLAEIYLIYAEGAAMGYGSSAGKDPNYRLNATEAINVVRDRAKVGRLATGLDLPTFMSELRRERAVELSFEGHRFNDLRRWLLLTEHPYNIKTAQEFDRAPGPMDVNNPQNNRVVNFREVVIIERQLTDKHYWLPIRVRDANIYEGFQQNPGW